MSLYKNSIIGIAGVVFQKSFRLLSTGILARYLGTYSFGVYTIFTTIVTLYRTISVIGLSGGLNKFLLSKTFNEISKRRQIFILVSFTTLIASLVLLFLLFLFRTEISSLFNINESLFTFILPLFPICAINHIFLIFLIAEKRVLENQMIINIDIIVNLIGICLSVYCCSINIYLAAKILFFSQAICVLIGAYSFRNYFKWQGVFEFDLFLKIMRYSSPFFLVSIFNTSLSSMDRLLAGIFMQNKEEVGIYNICATYAFQLNFLLSALISFISPYFAELFNNNNLPELSNLYSKIVKIICFLTFPLFLILYINADFFLGLTGNEYQSGIDSFRILLIGQLINVSTGPIFTFLGMANKPRLMLKAMVLVALVNFLGFYLLAPTFGLLGGSISTALSITFVYIFLLIYTSVVLKFHLITLENLKNYLLMGLILILTLFITHLKFTLISSILLVAIYVILYYLFVSKDNLKSIVFQVKNKTL